MDWYRRALEIDPRSVAAHNNIGNLDLHQGDIEAALTSYETALGIDPNMKLRWALIRTMPTRATT